MNPSTDQSSLDLLDAYLETLSDHLRDGHSHGHGHDHSYGHGHGHGADALPFPERAVPVGPGVGGEDEELLAWVLGRFSGIRREPKDTFLLEASSLLQEFRSRRNLWNAAALRLLDDPYTFVATGPRQHEDWAHDVLALMHRSVPDPRGWLRLDRDRTNPVRHSVPAYPFDPPAASRFSDRLYRLEREAAVAALAVMAEEWQAEPAPVRSRPDRDAVLADARMLLDRYGPAARYWTNATAAASDPAPDFLTPGLSAQRSHGFLTGEYVNGIDLLDDLGLIAVSENEVGVFWSIGAY
ncbi:hypothetical protein [Streptomyces sp. UNOB3_S3]|uniref:hypothetical protein n=1 Tax=Streptomyces sp. UNOB3_S3 TaxID=2871682 RepID=UPI001E5427DC|nr:hypothetical protein [Streptomyces sp. UNOB3_S3]